MLKRIAAALLALLLMVGLEAAALADAGFYGDGDFSDGVKRYGFDYGLAEIVYNGDISWQDYDEVYTGSAVYIPIMKDDESNISQATDKDIKNDKVTLSYKVSRGERYVDSVTIVNGGKEKIDGIESGAYVKVKLVDSFASTGTASIEVKMILVVNKISYQETEIELACTMKNREIIIDNDTVYGAQMPTLFEAGYDYTGPATFDMGGGVRYTGRVQAKKKYVIDYTAEADEAITARYPDAKLEFHSFRGNEDSFLGSGRLELPLAEKTYKKDGVYSAYVYTVSGNSLSRVPADQLEIRNGTLAIQTQTLHNYLVSDIDLEGWEAAYESPADAPPTSTGGQSSAPNQPPAGDPEAPPMGGAPMPDLTEPQAPPVSSATPPPEGVISSVNSIYAGNADTENPLTGRSPALPFAMLAGLLAGIAALGLHPGRRGR